MPLHEEETMTGKTGRGAFLLILLAALISATPALASDELKAGVVKVIA